MNVNNGKKISFNKSTLFNLKAELMKKQEEVGEKKRQPQHNLENFKPAPQHKPERPTNKTEKKSLKDNLTAVDTDELEACRKAKLALEKKAELYSHLSDSVGTSELSGRFLVDFGTKKLQKSPKAPSPVPSPEPTFEDDEINDDSEWMEFTDCLGRSRRCLKTDLQLYQKRDEQLIKNMRAESGIIDKDIPEAEEKPQQSAADKPLLMRTTEDYLQTLRGKWEQKESELLAKDSDIHYQDVLFDEARLHGVSYFSFSTDEAERRKQMDALKKTRDETLQAQQAAEEKRKKRDELVAARVAAARARQRLRAGLPPEDPEEKKKDYTACLLQFLNEQKNDADVKAKEEEQKIKAEKEKEREKLRQEYVREWDVGKDKVGEEKKEKFREMSQEEYVEKQRDKRLREFAPVQTATSRNSDIIFDDKGYFVDSELAPSNKTWADVRPNVDRSTLPPLPYTAETLTKGLYFSSSNKPDKVIKYKNFVSANEPSPIVNELCNDESKEPKKESRKRKTDCAEIAPPPTFDYYGPVSKHVKPNVPFTSDVNEAYEQGLKLLEKKEGLSKISDQYNFIL